jgi:putative ABC transport system permease protein
MIQLPDDGARAEAASQLIERLAQMPGIEAVGAATGLAAVTPQRGTRFAVEGRTLTSSQDTALFMAATPGYFRSLQTPVLQGRPIEVTDIRKGEPVVVLNRTLAQQLFPKGDAVGHRLKIVNPEQAADWRTIVGVVADVDYAGIQEEPRPAIYTPFVQTPFLWLYVMVRTPARLDAVLPVLRAAVPAVNPTLVAGDVRAMTDVLSLTVAEPRFNMLLVSAFAGLALVLSAIGIYGVIAYSVAQRTHEIGVRMALGARTSDVRRLVVREGAGVGAAGVALGLIAAGLLARLMAGLLFGIAPRDPITFAAGAALLLSIALAASYVPARRASRVEPVTALRES